MSIGIRAFIGPNGSGKTLAMVAKMAVPAWQRGEVVVANFNLYPEKLGHDPALYMNLGAWRNVARVGVHNLKLCEVHNIEKCNCGATEYTKVRRRRDGELWSITGNAPATLLFDEASSMFPSRETSALPAELGNLLQQFRKPHVTVGWSAPAWMRCDTMLRACTQFLTVCRGMLPDRWERDEDGKVLRNAEGKKVRRPWDPWGSNRLFKWTHYDAFDFEEWSSDLENSTKIKPFGKSYLWRPWYDFDKAYDTNDGVALSDHLRRVAWCEECDLPLRKENCKGHPAAAGTKA